MDINEIIPYARNARHNKKAIPAVADSIRQFGLRGQIVLESRENPVIVNNRIKELNKVINAGVNSPLLDEYLPGH